MTPETRSEIERLRHKQDSGELITLEEMRWAIETLRGDRRSAAQASESSRRKSAKAAIPSADDLLKELE